MYLLPFCHPNRCLTFHLDESHFVEIPAFKAWILLVETHGHLVEHRRGQRKTKEGQKENGLHGGGSDSESR